LPYGRFLAVVISYRSLCEKARGISGFFEKGCINDVFWIQSWGVKGCCGGWAAQAPFEEVALWGSGSMPGGGCGRHPQSGALPLGCCRNPPVSPSASHPPLARGGYGVGWRTTWDSLWERACFPPPTRPDNSGFGLQRKRSTAKGLPARDGSERRQIPLPFFGAGKGSSLLCKWRVS